LAHRDRQQELANYDWGHRAEGYLDGVLEEDVVLD
jgi:hypothetical protein